jgi:chromosome segregation ATPase
MLGSKSSKKELQRQLQALNTKNEALMKDNEELKQKHEAVSAKLMEKVKHNQELLDESTKEEEKNQQLQDQIDSLKHSFIESLDKSTIEIKTLKEELDNSLAKVATLEEQLANGGGSGESNSKMEETESKTLTNNTNSNTSNSSSGGDGEIEQLKQQLQAEKEKCARAEKEAAEANKIAMELTEEWDDKVREIEEINNTAILGEKLREAEAQIFKYGNKLVECGNKNVKLSDTIKKYKQEAAKASEEVKYVREAIMREIAGTHSNLNQDKSKSQIIVAELTRMKKYSNIPFPELIKLLAEAYGAQTIPGGNNGAGNGSDGLDKTNLQLSNGKTIENAESWKYESIKTIEREMSDLRTEVKSLQQKNERLHKYKDETIKFRDLLKTSEENYSATQEKLIIQKDKTSSAREDTRRSNERVKALSEHIEKLMVHLKHEAAAKARTSSGNRRLKKELVLYKERNEALILKNRGRERVIRELREGCRILEDQLRLMDEKYIELRNKLDWTRNQSQKEVRKIQAEANKLRVKWMMIAGSTDTLKTLGVDNDVGHDDMNNIARSQSTSAIPKQKKQRPHTINNASNLPPLDTAPGTTMNELFANGIENIGSDDVDENPEEPWSDTKLSSLHDWASQKK